MTKLNYIFLDGEDMAISEKSYDGVSGPNLPITVLKWKPWPHSVFKLMSGGKSSN